MNRRTFRQLAFAACLAAAALSAGCEAAGTDPGHTRFPATFRFGVATAAHQVEGGQTNTWSEFETLPLYAGKTAHPAGDATDFYHRYAQDFDLAADLGMDVFRMSIEWSRVEPARGAWDADEIAHYRRVFEALAERDLRPSVTLHHFSEPTWWLGQSGLTAPVEDSFCAGGPTDAAFCGFHEKVRVVKRNQAPPSRAETGVHDSLSFPWMPIRQASIRSHVRPGCWASCRLGSDPFGCSHLDDGL